MNKLQMSNFNNDILSEISDKFISDDPMYDINKSISLNDINSLRTVNKSFLKAVDTNISNIMESKKYKHDRYSDFMENPEQRNRKFKIYDNSGKKYIDKKYNSCTFSVRFAGAIQGDITHRYDVNKSLQKDTFFKLRMGITFSRLFDALASRQKIDKDTLVVRLADRMYKTNKINLKYGSAIKPHHTLWSLGIENNECDYDIQEYDINGIIHKEPINEVWFDYYIKCNADECFMCIHDSDNKLNSKSSLESIDSIYDDSVSWLFKVKIELPIRDQFADHFDDESMSLLDFTDVILSENPINFVVL